jgi:hypothetical protein
MGRRERRRGTTGFQPKGLHRSTRVISLIVAILVIAALVISIAVPLATSGGK